MIFEEIGQFEEYFSQPSRAILGLFGTILGPLGAMLEPSSPILKLLGAKMRCKSENIGSSANSTEFSKTRLSFLRGPRCGPRAKMMILLRFLNDFYWGHVGAIFAHIEASWGQDAVQEPKYWLKR